MSALRCVVAALIAVVCGIGTATAEPAGPPAGYEIDPEFTQTFADGAITIEQYVNKKMQRNRQWPRHATIL